MRWISLFIMLFPVMAHAQNERAPEIPELAVEIITADGGNAPVYVQQQVLMKVTLISRHPFRTLQVEMPPIKNAEIHVASRAKTREFSTYGGSGWRHQRITALFPLRSGTWTLPSVTASGSIVKPDGSVQGFEVTTPAQNIEVQPAHAYLNGFWWITAEDIALTQTYSRDLAELKIGDTVTRTVRMAAKGTTAERLPELNQGTTPGITVQEAGSTQTTRFSPDGGTAEVVRSWEITVHSQNPVNIAPVSVTWWHTVESRPASSGVPAGRIEPLAVDAEKQRAELLAEAAAERDSGAYILFALVLLLTLPVAVLCLALVLAALPTKADLRLRRQLRDASGMAPLHALVHWGQASVDPSIRTVRDLLHQAPADVSQSLRKVQHAAYGSAKRQDSDTGRMLRWARSLRFARLRKKIIRAVEKSLGQPVRS